MRVLVVEDDEAIAGPLIEGLRRHGYEVDHTRSGVDAVGLAGGVDVVLLDLGLPDLDGTEVCRQVRSTSDVPLIVVTARGDEIDRVVLLELGADDYLVKPFGFRELVARIGAVTRRSGLVGARTAAPEALGRLHVDRSGRRVRVDGTAVDLTPKEFDLLAVLTEEPGTVRTREELIDRVWDPHWFGPTKTLDVHVAALRRKLGDAAPITTIRGVGYRFEAPG